MENAAPENNGRSFHSLTWVYPVALGLALALTGLGLFLAMGRHQGWEVFAAGCLASILVLVAWPLGLILHSTRQRENETRQLLLSTITDRLQQLSVLVELISEQQLLSDRAKAVAFREKDRDALRRAIQEELGRQDWEAAIALVDNIEGEFGYRQEADRFREMINDRRRDAVRRQVADAVAIVDRHMRAEQWSLALREADRLATLFPGDPQVKALPGDIEARRQAHKHRLLGSWTEAVNRHDIDGSIEILKQLDMYLTPSEAESMQETARGLFREKLNTLRDDFAKAVQDHHHAEALRIAESIVRDFPNSGMARELRDKLDALRDRAAEEQQPAAASA